MNNVIFGKTMGTVGKRRHIKQQKEKEASWCQNQIIVLQSFPKNFLTTENSNIQE